MSNGFAGQFGLYVDDSAGKFLGSLASKQYKQIAARIFSLSKIPRPHDSQALGGYPGLYRLDQGEFRVIYRIDYENKIVTIQRVGRRNDDAVYRGL
jgi:mRNA interferase RelE/StbE